MILKFYLTDSVSQIRMGHGSFVRLPGYRCAFSQPAGTPIQAHRMGNATQDFAIARNSRTGRPANFTRQPARSTQRRAQKSAQHPHNICINAQWRICFVRREGGVYQFEFEVEIVDYHQEPNMPTLLDEI